MIGAEKRARDLRHPGRVVLPMIVFPLLVTKAFKLHDGVISVSDFIWCMAIIVPPLFLMIFSPFLEERRQRRLKHRREEQRRPFLNLEA